MERHQRAKGNKNRAGKKRSELICRNKKRDELPVALFIPFCF
jgi:hypothetical protein